MDLNAADAQVEAVRPDSEPSHQPKRTKESAAEHTRGGAHINSKRSYLLRRFWVGALGFWGERGTLSAWVLPGLIFLAIVANLGALYGMNLWNRALFDGLEKHNSQSVLFLSLIYFPIMLASVFFSVMQVYGRMTLQRRWRAWLNDHLVERWLANGRYYHLNLVSGGHQNPEYRIADDVRVATESPIDFAAGVTSALLSAVTFVVVLWSIGGTLEFAVGGQRIAVPGFLVVAAVVYALIASGLITLIGRGFVPVSETKNQAEAEYRYVLTRLRENGESIALIRGEEEERAGVDRSLGRVLSAWRDLCIQHMKTTVVSQTSSYVAPILPVILCAPKYLDGSLTLGQVMQAASAFTIVQAAFNWLVDNYPRLADWTASARRAAALMVSLDALEAAESGGAIGRIEVTEGSGEAALRLIDLSVTLDDGTAVVDEAEVSIMPGERVLIVGESGTGKSTLVRAIAGLWPWGEGKIEVRKGAKVFFLPQRPYIPLGTLRRAATYPDEAESRTVEDVAGAFRHVGLDQLVEHLDNEGPWDQTLSGGEKQRLAFARVFLHRPDIIVLDEATAALDPQSQDRLMTSLIKQPAKTTLVSVGHRLDLEPYHNRKITLERRRGSTRLVSDVRLAPKWRFGDLLRRWWRRVPPPSTREPTG
jgi:vitamin B12/bleomycin/antimicrobial peptide transport system ATP-binding/permease protein